MTMDEITSGLGSMSAMLIIISIVAIGAVMAIRNKIVNKRRRRTQAAEEPARSESHQQEPSSERPRTETETSVDSELDRLKKDMDD